MAHKWTASETASPYPSLLGALNILRGNILALNLLSNPLPRA
jgi:hypothetical protein